MSQLKKGPGMRTLFIFLTAVLHVILSSSSAGAVTYQVDGNDPHCDNVLGNPYCTIQAVLNIPGIDGDTIHVAPGIYSENLTAGVSFILEGEDPANTIIDGGGAGSVFNITAAAIADVSLSNITIRNGNSPTLGGGIQYLGPGSLSLVNCRVLQNVAGDQGGGISHVNGQLTINQSWIIDNEATNSGGGILQVNGDLNVSESQISYNEAVSGSGGALLHVNDSLTITGSEIIANGAQETAGGILKINGSFQLSGSQVNYNESRIQSGGGIAHVNGNFTVEDSKFVGMRSPTPEVSRAPPRRFQNETVWFHFESFF